MASAPVAHDPTVSPASCDVTGKRQGQLVTLCAGAPPPYDTAVYCLAGVSEGTITVQLDIGEDGTVCRATTLQAELERDVVECVLERVSTWRKLPPGRARYTITKPDPAACRQ
jgi:hypothetical protein